MADWRYNAKQDLREYHNLKTAVVNLEEEIAQLEADVQTVKSVTYDKTPVQGGASGREDTLILNIDRRERLGANLEAVRAKVERIERGLSELSAEERRVLELFHLNRPKDYIDRLCAELGYERSHVYRLEAVALKKFTISMYGVVDL